MKLRLMTPLIVLTFLGIFGCPDEVPKTASPLHITPVAGAGITHSTRFSMQVTISGPASRDQLVARDEGAHVRLPAGH